MMITAQLALLMKARVINLASIQNKVGKITEKEVTQVLRDRHYYVYRTPSKANGQPVDIIAIRGSSNWLIDAKHLRGEEASFSLSRIEPNQLSTFQYAEDWAKIFNLGFAIYSEREQNNYWLSYTQVKELISNNQKSIKIEKLELFEDVLDREEKNENDNR